MLETADKTLDNHGNELISEVEMGTESKIAHYFQLALSDRKHTQFETGKKIRFSITHWGIHITLGECLVNFCM